MMISDFGFRISDVARDVVAFVAQRLRDWRDARDWRKIWRDPAGFFQGNCACCGSNGCCSPGPPSVLNYSITELSNCPCAGFPKTGTLTQIAPDYWDATINNADGCDLLSLQFECLAPKTACTNFRLILYTNSSCNMGALAQTPVACVCPLNATFEFTVCSGSCVCCGGGILTKRVTITITE